MQTNEGSTETTDARPLDLERIRQAFPVLNEVVYLNVGTYGIMAEPALAEFQRIQAEYARRGVAVPRGAWNQADGSRARIATLLGALPEEIAFTRNATDGIDLALAGIDWQPGDEVITSEQEHEAINHPLLYLQRMRGIKVRFVPVTPDPATMLKNLDAAATPRTRLVAISQVTCETGARTPAKQICQWAAERGILSLIDGAQALGVFRVDLHDMGCDFYTTNGHKWLGGPKGTGFFYGRLDRLPDMLLAHLGAGSLEHVDIATGVAEPWKTAKRFEFGTQSWAPYIALGATLDWLEALGWANIERHIASLSDYLKGRILERPYLRMLTPRAFEESSGLTSFVFAGHTAVELGQTLREQYGIYVRTVPHYECIRIATAHFNNQTDVDRLMTALDAIARG